MTRYLRASSTTSLTRVVRYSRRAPTVCEDCGAVTVRYARASTPTVSLASTARRPAARRRTRLPRQVLPGSAIGCVDLVEPVVADDVFEAGVLRPRAVHILRVSLLVEYARIHVRSVQRLCCAGPPTSATWLIASRIGRSPAGLMG
jgi:hypothetical protein